jgi:hypothetical protein
MVVITSIIVVHEFIIIGINQASHNKGSKGRRKRWKRQSMGSGLRMNLSSSAVTAKPG